MVDENGLAKFDNSKVALSEWNKLSDKDYFVTINTGSARKADRNNLLQCNDPIDRRIASFKDKTIEVQCRLIGEPSSPVN